MDGVVHTRESDERPTSRPVVPRDRDFSYRAIREPRLDYVTRKDATPDAEIRALAEAYRFLLDRSEQQPTTHRDDEGANREGSRE